MSIDVVIRPKGLFKKPMPLSVILGDQLQFGAYGPGLRLEQNSTGNGELVLYHPAHKGRGFTLSLNPGRRRELLLRALHPTCAEELRDFYATVARIAAHQPCALTVDGNPMTLAEFQAGLPDMLEVNDRYLSIFIEKSMDCKRYESMTLFSAFWPLEFGAKEAEETQNAPEGPSAHFARWLHEMQSIDTYYAVVGFSAEEDGTVGRFAFTEECDSLFPVKPAVPFGVSINAAGASPEVSRYEVALVSTTLQKVIGTIPYESFMTALNPDKVSYYDAKRVRIAPHSLTELKELIAKAGA